MVASNFRCIVVALFELRCNHRAVAKPRCHPADDRVYYLRVGLHCSGPARRDLYTNGVKLKLLQSAALDPSAASESSSTTSFHSHLADIPVRWIICSSSPGPKPGAKIRIEVKLQCLVCSGQVSLGEAQTAIAVDWEGASRYASVPCHREKHPTVHQNLAGAWIARVKHWLTSSGWRLVRGSI